LWNGDRSLIRNGNTAVGTAPDQVERILSSTASIAAVHIDGYSDIILSSILRWRWCSQSHGASGAEKGDGHETHCGERFSKTKRQGSM
jgi:hypothetical protein